MKVGSSVFLLLLLVELSPTLGRRKSTQAPGRKCRGGGICKYKIHEQSSRPVNVQLCGNDIIKAFRNICRLGVKRKSKRDISADLIIQTKNEAQDFLSLTRRRKRSSTDVIEECCGEWCRVEELREYCP
ncbi:unnamed protein product [Porites lobata]|uniref:Insulin-like domain-containing protein n=1 Tax=Porites lobata TaxID=104759 RepID=A0ABN8N0K9_9CNID|nr:unnamed protein product [Porites lobata]